MDIYSIIALIFIALCAIPILYLFFFIGRIIFWVIKDFFEKKVIIAKDDHVFGKIEKKGKEDWEAVVPYFLDKNEKVILTIDAGEKGPTKAQRELFIRIKESFPSLYEKIILKIAEYHDTLKTSDEILKYIELPMLSINKEKGSWEIQYTLDLESEGDMGYIIDFKDLKLINIMGVD